MLDALAPYQVGRYADAVPALVSVLADIGVLGKSVMLTHLADIDESEFELLVESSAGAILCPHAALQGDAGHLVAAHAARLHADDSATRVIEELDKALSAGSTAPRR